MIFKIIEVMHQYNYELLEKILPLKALENTTKYR